MPSKTYKILLFTQAYDLDPARWNALASKHGLELVQSTAKNHSEFLEYFANNDIVLIANTVSGSQLMGAYTPELIAQIPDGLKAVCHEGCGYDVAGPLDAWKAKGVQVSNAPEGVIRATADTALYLTLGTLRNFAGLGRSLYAGTWRGGLPLADDSKGKTLGLIGLGTIGSLARDKIVGALDFDKVQYFSRRRAVPEIEKGSVHVDFDTLLATSDVILISVPLTKATQHLINRETIAKCKDGVFIINTARGGIVDEQALVEGLDSGKIKSVGLDVYENEPTPLAGLLENPRALLLPHVGPYTMGSVEKMTDEVLTNVETFLDTGKVVNLVPELRA